MADAAAIDRADERRVELLQRSSVYIDAATSDVGANGWIDLKRCALESLTSIKRAGADLILTYFAKDAVRWLEGQR